MHRWSKLFIPTLREAPADAEVASHKLLLRAGYIRQLGAGIYSYLPLGQRSLTKILAIVRQEMDKIGQEFLLPALNPRELWEESGRWTAMGENMFRLKDRKGAELCLAMTHEEVVTSIARNELRSYKQLPQIWYQIQTKFRDEPRPKSGLLRVRQFLMKDSYSFDLDAAGLDVSYNKHDAAYRAIFTRCGLEFVAVEADSGAMGGSQSQEFMVYTDAGEDLIVSCPSCGYAANLEKAVSRLTPVDDLPPAGDGLPELVPTPGVAAIADVAEFFKISPAQDIKTVAYMALRGYSKAGEEIWEPVAAFLRGDHFVNETKLLGALAARELRTMNGDELERYFHGPAGYLGPIGLKPKEVSNPGSTPPAFSGGEIIVVVDPGLLDRSNMVCGANQLDFHFRNVTPGRDLTWTLAADIRNVNGGEACVVCGTPLRKPATAVEVGHIFKLGTKYTESMGSRVLDATGKEITPIMGCYGIGLECILTAAIESSARKFASLAANDPGSSRQPAADQFALPAAIAPFEVIVTVTNVREPDLLAAGERIAAMLDDAGVDVLLDDRDERAGVKFKDAELIGVPFRINVGKKLSEGRVELVDRLNQTTIDLPLEAIAPHLRSLLHGVGPGVDRSGQRGSTLSADVSTLTADSSTLRAASNS